MTETYLNHREVLRLDHASKIARCEGQHVGILDDTSINDTTVLRTRGDLAAKPSESFVYLSGLSTSISCHRESMPPAIPERDRFRNKPFSAPLLFLLYGESNHRCIIIVTATCPRYMSVV